MNVPATGTLSVEGATLYYEMRGSGPPLLMIPGGGCDAGIFDGVAGPLAGSFTVISFDPRGRSRSQLAGPAEDQRAEIHGEDASRLLARLTPEAAFIFGSSSGAVAGLELAARHPGQVRLLVAHEPPLVRLLPDAARARAFIDDVHETYLRAGAGPAMAKFAGGIGMDSPGGQGRPGPPGGGRRPGEAVAMIRRMHATIDRMQANTDFFLAHELRQFSSFVPDIGALQAVSDRIILGTGRESAALLPGRPATVLAARLGSETAEFPGGHAGYATDPADFAERLAGVLAGAGSAGGSTG
jgi:pimeloyl-ACP methyl ester carboxylesterase